VFGNDSVLVATFLRAVIAKYRSVTVDVMNGFVLELLHLPTAVRVPCPAKHYCTALNIRESICGNNYGSKK
jgi:hypothetical protein